MHGGKREGSGRTPLPENKKKIAKTIYVTPTQYDDIEKIITRSNALLSVFGDNYDTIQKEALKYFDGFKERR